MTTLHVAFILPLSTDTSALNNRMKININISIHLRHVFTIHKFSERLPAC